MSYAKRESRSRLDPFAEKLAQRLKTESGKNRKQRRTLKQMHAELMELGYDGSYNRDAAFARDWGLKRREAQKTTGRGSFVPLRVLGVATVAVSVLVWNDEAGRQRRGMGFDQRGCRHLQTSVVRRRPSCHATLAADQF